LSKITVKMYSPRHTHDLEGGKNLPFVHCEFIEYSSLFFVWRFETIPVDGLPLRGFAITF